MTSRGHGADPSPETTEPAVMVLAAGQATAFAQALSLAALTYTSRLTDGALYASEQARERRHIETVLTACLASVALSSLPFFGPGAHKAHVTVGSMRKSDLEISLLGLLSAATGYLVGRLFGISA